MFSKNTGVLLTTIRWSSPSYYLARPDDFSCSWSSKPAEFLGVMQILNDNLN